MRPCLLSCVSVFLFAVGGANLLGQDVFDLDSVIENRVTHSNAAYDSHASPFNPYALDQYPLAMAQRGFSSHGSQMQSHRYLPNRTCAGCASKISGRSKGDQAYHSAPEVMFGANAGLPSFGFISHGVNYNGPRKVLLSKKRCCHKNKNRHGGRTNRGGKRSQDGHEYSAARQMMFANEHQHQASALVANNQSGMKTQSPWGDFDTSTIR